MDIRWLEDFLSLAHTRSFARSAAERHVSQPAFGRRIKAIEAWVGVALVDRSSYPCSLTREGQLFRDSAQEAVRVLAEARAQLRVPAASSRRGVSIATGKTLSLTFFPEWLARLGATAGGLDLRLSTTHMLDGMMQLMEGGADFLLCYCHPEIPVLLDPQQFEYRRVGEERLLPVSAPDQRGAPRFALPGSAHSPLPLLYLPPSTTQGRILDSYLAQNPGPLFLERRIEADFSEAVAVLAEQGLGLAWVPERVARSALARGSLVKAGSARHALELEVRLYRGAANRRAGVEDIWQAVAPNDAGLAHRATAAEA